MNKPTDSELEILQILWEKGPSTVRTVNDTLNYKRKVGYTTSLKIMQIMAEKGLLERELINRSHIYSPSSQPEDIRRTVLDHLVQTAFNGNTSNLVLQALGHHKVSNDEINAIKDLLKRIEEDQNGTS
jgi:predicted transcriptional regulator